VDVVGIEKNFERYASVALLGWNTMDADLMERLRAYVLNGGELALGICHLNTVDRNDREMSYLKADFLGEMLGFEMDGTTFASGDIDALGEKGTLSGKAKIATGRLTTGECVLADADGNPLVVKNTYGKGTVYLMTFADYVVEEADTIVHRAVLKMMGQKSLQKVDNANVSFTVRETDTEYVVSVLNMNCIEGATEKFNLTCYGNEISDEIAVGEIKEYVFEK
jgi:hypothetical protein